MLILGGTAFTGPHTVRRLVELGHEVTVFHRGRHEPDLPPAVRHVHGDRRELRAHRDELLAAAPDVVLDMLAFTAEDAEVLVEVFRGSAGRLVVPSSADVYRAYGRLHRTESGPPDPAPFTEGSPLREELSIHGTDYDKTAVERIVTAVPDLPATVLRLPAIYGPGDGQHRLFPYLKRIDDGRPAILLGERMARWRFTHGYVENVALAITLAMTDSRAAGRTYNAGEPETLPWVDWVRAIGRAAGWDGEVVVVPDDRLPAHLKQDLDWDHSLWIDSGRIRRELGYREAVSSDEALRRTLAWERENPPPTVDPGQFDYAAEDAVLA